MHRLSPFARLTAARALGEAESIFEYGATYVDRPGHYASFVELWATADEELQPRVRAAQARLEEILREIG